MHLRGSIYAISMTKEDQVGFKITQRVDGRLLLREAVKCLQMKAA